MSVGLTQLGCRVHDLPVGFKMLVVDLVHGAGESVAYVCVRDGSHDAARSETMEDSAAVSFKMYL